MLLATTQPSRHVHRMILADELTPQQTEARRQTALARYAVVGHESDPGIERIARLAASIFDTPYAFISLLDGQRCHYKACLGLDALDIPQSETICRLVLEQDAALILRDTHQDPRSAGARAVIGPPFARFYAGAPLIAGGGERLGVISVMDTVPRPDFSEKDGARLSELAATVMLLLDREREQVLQAEAAAEYALLNDILTGLNEATTLTAAVDGTLSRLLHATTAAMCTLTEFRPSDGLVHLISMHVAPSHNDGRFDGVYDTMPARPDRLVLGHLFEDDSKTYTQVMEAVPPGAFAVRDRQVNAGICCSVHLSMHVGEFRFVLSLAFDTLRDDLPAIRLRLARMQRAIRPMLRRKLDEERLRLMSAAVAVASDMVMILDAESRGAEGRRIVFVNEAFSRITGWSREDVVGNSARVVQSPETDQNELNRIRQAMLNGEVVRAELLNVCKDGRRIWVELDMSPLRDNQGRISHFVTVSRDITERRRRETADRETAATVKRLADELLTANRIARMGTWRWTSATKTLLWSDEVCRMFGVDPASFNISLSQFMTLVHPDDVPRVRERIGTSFGTDSRVEVDLRVITPAGVTLHCHVEGQTELDADGRQIGVHGFCQDVTERRQVESMMLHTEKLKSIGQLTGGIAHDFNNLLTVISINVELARDIIDPGHPAAELLTPALQAANSGAELTSSLLAFARRQPLNPQPIEINRVLSDFHAMAVRSLGERHGLALVLAEALPPCRLDRVKLENAVLNLILNSRDAMEDGGIITISTGFAHISLLQARRIGELRAGPHVTLAVKDTGCGIPPEIQSQVFDPFYTTKGVGKGTGLGLSMVMGFVRQSGGQVTLDSRPGEGTTVTLYLPAEAAA